MNYFVTELKNIYKLQGGILTAYIADKLLDDGQEKLKRPAVIVVPGGGYWFCSKREQEPVVFKFLAEGYNVFTLEYLCREGGVEYPEQLLELACAVDYIRKNADEFSINDKEIFAVGFSAGGHLIANLSSDYTIAQGLYDVKIEPQLTAAGLIYPAISDEYFNDDIFNQMGIRVDVPDKLRLDRLVCERTAPAYILSTSADKLVPSLNALKYAEAMAKNGIEYELHVYKNGEHGISAANAEINNSVEGLSRNRNWISNCASFFREYCIEKF